jgi:hypothetical protein
LVNLIKKFVDTELLTEEKLNRKSRKDSPQLKKKSQNSKSVTDVVFEILKYF